MAEIDILLEQIAGDQGNDALRWRAATLDDRQGNRDRARFIRLQLQLAQLPGGVDSPEWLPMMEESERLHETHYAEWNAPYEYLQIVYAQYDRGFIEEVGVQGQTLLVEDDRHEIFRRLPIRHIDIADLRGTHLQEILRVSELRRMVSLGFDRLGLSDGDVAVFGDSELPELRWLSLTRNELTLEGVSQLARLSRRSMPLLQFVDLRGNPYDPADEIDYDQHVALTWRRGAEPGTEDLIDSVPWWRPRIVDGRVDRLDRLALARPAASRSAG